MIPSFQNDRVLITVENVQAQTGKNGELGVFDNLNKLKGEINFMLEIVRENPLLSQFVRNIYITLATQMRFLSGMINLNSILSLVMGFGMEKNSYSKRLVVFSDLTNE